jgi:hypothetical protein
MDQGVPRTADYLWDLIKVIRNALWLSQFSQDWYVLRRFHDHFEQCVKNAARPSRHTRPHDVGEIMQSYEYAMRIWEEGTKKIYLKQVSKEDPKSFDDILRRMTAEEDYTYQGFFDRLTPRVKAVQESYSWKDSSWKARGTKRERWTSGQPWQRSRTGGDDTPPPKGKGKGKPKAKAKPKAKPKARFTLWSGARRLRVNLPTGGNSGGGGQATPPAESQPSPDSKGGGKGKGKKGKGKSKQSGKSEQTCFFFADSGTCPRDNCRFAHVQG